MVALPKVSALDSNTVLAIVHIITSSRSAGMYIATTIDTSIQFWTTVISKRQLVALLQYATSNMAALNVAKSRFRNIDTKHNSTRYSAVKHEYRGRNIENRSQKNIQHQAFAGRHRPNYYSGAHGLSYRGADGTRRFLVAMVVCVLEL